MVVRRSWLVPGALLLATACQPAAAPTPAPPTAPPPTPTTSVSKPSAASPVPSPAVAAPSPLPSPSPVASPAPVVGTPLPVTSTRTEVLNAANAAFARGSFGEAAGLYERVVNTPPATGEAAILDDFAHFRAMLALLAQGQEEDARDHLDALVARDRSAPLARLADQVWNQYSMTTDVRAACAQAQQDIASQAGPALQALQSAGVTADAASLCRIP